MSQGQFREVLFEAIETYHRAAADGKITYGEYLGIGEKLFCTAENLCAGIGGDDEKFNELVEDTEYIYRKYIAPIDIPGISNWIEPYVDSQGELLIRPALELARPKGE